MVSILIPCYNAEKWIHQTVDSALSQTVSDKEIIVIDDGSTDSSVDILRSFGSRIHLETGPNRGGNSARNSLLKLAKGEWVQFLDADDFLKPKKIATQLDVATPDTDVIYSPVSVVINDGTTSSNIIEPNLSLDLYGQWFDWKLCQTGALLWRKSSLEKINGWKKDLPCCQDNELCMRALMNKFNFSYCSYPGAVYRIWSEETVSRKNSSKVINMRTQLMDEMIAWLSETKKLTDQHISAAGQASFEMARAIATLNISHAKNYVTKQKNKGIFKISGPAAPPKFLICCRLFGYANAERIATLFR